MFKKNPNRPDLNIALKKTSQGYRLVQNEAFQLFTTKKIIRSIYRPDLIQMSAQHIQGVGNNGGMASGTIIQPPSHVTLPAVSAWFKEDQIHEIERQNFPEYFRSEINSDTFSFSVKNANLYQYYRNSMVFMWRENAKKYLSPSLCRKNLLGDVSSIMRIHAFLENWGLINFPSKQHNKGIVISKPENIVCYVCQISDSKTYYVAEIEDVLFQICSDCFDNDFYPQSIKKAQFRKILYENHVNNEKEMDKTQITRMLEIINGIPNGVPKDKDRDTWSVIQKEFPGNSQSKVEISRQKILKTFLKIPLNVDMNSNIFQNNEDIVTFTNPQLKKQIEGIKQPSVFEDFQNPILGSIAHMYYVVSRHKTLEEINHDEMVKEQQETLKIQEIQSQKEDQQVEFYKSVLKASEEHSKVLCVDQQRKIKDLTKMLIDVVLSRLELKSLFISEYEKLVLAQEQVGKNLVKNNLAEALKCNIKLLARDQNQDDLDQVENLNEKENVPNQSPKHNSNNNEEIWDDNDLDL